MDSIIYLIKETPEWLFLLFIVGILILEIFGDRP